MIIKQVQIASDNVKGFVFRLTENEIESFADNEYSFDDLIQRLKKTISIVDRFKEQDYENADKVKIILPWMVHAMPGKFLTAEVYLNQFAIPNFYFHVVTAYDIIRGQGVALGKNDYIGALEISE